MNTCIAVGVFTKRSKGKKLPPERVVIFCAALVFIFSLGDATRGEWLDKCPCGVVVFRYQERGQKCHEFQIGRLTLK